MSAQGEFESDLSVAGCGERPPLQLRSNDRWGARTAVHPEKPDWRLEDSFYFEESV